MKNNWTVMVYMAGNNSLSGAASQDLAEIRNIGSTDSVQVATFVKQRDKAAVQRLVAKQAEKDVVTTLPAATDSGSPQTVLDFARWAIDKAPADRYALVLWNHGGAWSPNDLDQLYQQVRGGENRHEVNRLGSRKLKRTIFAPSVEAVLKLDDPRERAICSDDTSGHSLDTIEMARVTQAIVTKIGKPIDLFGMDACLMSALEVAYQIRKHACAVVGSEDLEPGAGWKYDAVLGALNANPTMDGPTLAKTVVQTYVDSYKNRSQEWPVTQCAVDPTKCDAFAKALDTFVSALRPKLPSLWTEVFKAQAKATSFEFEMVDLSSFCRILGTSTTDAAVRDAARAVVEALAPGKFVLAEGHLGKEVADCRGVSIYLPSPVNSEISRFYKDLDFAKQHRWDELLKSYFAAAKA